MQDNTVFGYVPGHMKYHPGVLYCSLRVKGFLNQKHGVHRLCRGVKRTYSSCILIEKAEYRGHSEYFQEKYYSG